MATAEKTMASKSRKQMLEEYLERKKQGKPVPKSGKQNNKPIVTTSLSPFSALQVELEQAKLLSTISYKGGQQMFKDILSSMSIARQSVAYWVARAKAAQTAGYHNEAMEVFQEANRCIYDVLGKKALRASMQELIANKKAFQSPMKENVQSPTRAPKMKREKSTEEDMREICSGASRMVLSEVRTPNKQRQAVGTPTMAVPVRRSIRNDRGQITSDAQVLQKTNFSYTPNKALQGSSFPKGMKGKSAKKMFDFENQSP